MSHRRSMFASVIRDAIAPVLRRCPPACGIVTITRVEISEDSSYATVYVSALKNPEEALAFVHGEQKDLQRVLHEIPRRKIPMLRFRLDDSSERGSRIEKLLEEASKGLPRDSSAGTQE